MSWAGTPARSRPPSVAARLDGDEAGHRLEEGRFAGAVRAEESHDLARGDGEGGAPDDGEPRLVAGDQVPDLEGGDRSRRRAGGRGGRRGGALLVPRTPPRVRPPLSFTVCHP